MRGPSVWMPWYIGDYLRATTHLDHVQDGAYRRLIDACWLRDGVLPDDDARLARITKLPPKLWKAVRPVVAEFFEITIAGWRHKRVERELAKANAITEARRTGGRKGAAKRWADNSMNGSSPDSSSIAGSMDEPLGHSLGDLIGEPKGTQRVGDAPSQSLSPPQSQNSSLRSRRAREADEPFDTWWDEYPHKIAKPKARKAFAAALKRASPEELLAGLRRYIETKPPDRQWCNPATWLDGDRWNDEPAPPEQPSIDRGRGQTSIFDIIAKIRLPGEEAP